MIAKTIPAFYDASGRKVFRPFERRKGPKPTFPMGRYVSHPLSVHCASMEDVRKFLLGCKVASDKEQFGKEEYWLPPEEFEKTKRGDCEDFALWTWRQLVAMGYDARFVAGRSGRYGAGHAWVEFFQDGDCYLSNRNCAGWGFACRALALCVTIRASLSVGRVRTSPTTNTSENGHRRCRSGLLFDSFRNICRFGYDFGFAYWSDCHAYFGGSSESCG